MACRSSGLPLTRHLWESSSHSRHTDGPIMLLDVMSAAGEVLGADNWRGWSFRRGRA